MDNKKPRVKRCPIQLSPSTYEKFRFLSKGQGMATTDFMAKLADQLMQLCVCHDTNAFHIVYQFEVFPEKKLTISTEGASSFVIGQVSEAELEAERKSRFDEVKLSIAELNSKNVRVKEVKEK